MGQYYYVVASLPALSLDAAHFPTRESFLELCRTWLSRRDLTLVEQAQLIGATHASVDAHTRSSYNELLRKWYEFEFGLRNEMARQRALYLKKDATLYLRTDKRGETYQAGSTLAETVRVAVQEANPLAAERTLDTERWRYLEELGQGHYFDVEALQVYHLRLQLLTRMRLFTPDNGAERFKQVYESLAAAINSGQHHKIMSLE